MSVAIHHRLGVPSAALRAAVRDIGPVAVGIVPLAAMIGVVVTEVPVHPAIGWLSGPIIAGGSAQLAVLGALGGSTLSAIVLGLLVNARALVYGATLAPVFARQPRWFRLVAPYFLVDQMFALAVARADADEAWMRTYYLGAAGILYATFTSWVAVGMALGPVIAPDSPITLAIPIMFATFLLRGLEDRSGVVTALVAGLVAALGRSLPAGLGLIAAIVVGTSVGMLVGGGSDE